MENGSVITDDQLGKYRIAVENLAASKSKFIFPNKDALHAAIVIEAIFNHSTSICICDDDLSGDIADESDCLQDAIEHAVKQGKNVRFLIDDVSHSGSGIYQRLEVLAQNHPNLQVKKAKDGFFEKLKMASSEILKTKTGQPQTLPVSINFAVGDDCAFRIEFPGEEKRSAFCSFNNEEITSKLLALFEQGFAEAKLIFDVVI